MWTDIEVVVEDQRIGVAIELLPEEGRARVAAAMAWFALQEADGSARAEPEEWQTFMERTILRHVRFTVPTDHLPGASSKWWAHASQQAIVAFVRVNSLAPAIALHYQLAGCGLRRCPRM